VTDHDMPGMSGLDLTREIARIRPDLPILLSSGLVTDDLRSEARPPECLRSFAKRTVTAISVKPCFGCLLRRKGAAFHGANSATSFDHLMGAE